MCPLGNFFEVGQFWCTENGRFMYSQIGPYRKLPFSVHRWRETTETIGVGGSAEAPFSGGFRPQRALAELPADVAGMELANSPCSCRSAVHCGKCTKNRSSSRNRPPMPHHKQDLARHSPCSARS